MHEINIPGFEIEESLSDNKTYQVLKAFQTSLERNAVIKVIPLDRENHPDAVDAFMAETQAAARLEHSFIVPIIDANSMDSFCYIITEFVDGYTIADWLKKDGHIPEPETLVVAEYVTEAMEHIHSQSCLNHGDMKPANVMLDSDGSIRLRNIGMSSSRQYILKIDPDTHADDSYTTPEQLEGNIEASVQSDIYMLGAMLYHMATGQHPYTGIESDDDLIPDPLDITKSIPQAFCWLLEKMLAKNPAERHESWAELMEDIKMVQKKKNPSSGIIPPGHSMMARSPKRKPAKPGKKVILSGKKPASSKKIAARGKSHRSPALRKRYKKSRSGDGTALKIVVIIGIILFLVIFLSQMSRYQ